ncbi:MAG: hypothetical protein Kow0029_26220 [Candidatus Rifleibacteriota bacterium]
MRRIFLICLLFTILIFVRTSGKERRDNQIPRANLRFSHKTHSRNSIECARCHVNREDTRRQGPDPMLPPGWQPLRKSNIVATGINLIFPQNDEIDDTFGRPGEKRCLQCHFKTREKSRCALCHLETPGKTIRDRKRLKEGFVFSHKKHEKFECSECHNAITNWENLDGNMIKSRMEDCLVCHTGAEVPKNCVMCHDPTPRPADHLRNYEKKHGVAYRADPQHCRMCHEESSCLECHSRKPRSHTLAWVRHRHGIAAKTNPQKCQACHSDPWVCARCHNDNRFR